MLNKENIYKLSNPTDAMLFLMGGKAIFTIESKKTGKWFTYKINRLKSKEEDKSKLPLFVSVLTGPENESSYSYLGTIFMNNTPQYRLTKKSRIGKDAISHKAFDYFFKLLVNGKINENMNIFHRGICSSCGRTLTTPESIKNGLGPVCRGKKVLTLVEERLKKLQKLNSILV